ncbi:MAG: DUF1211 domain-containing protein [Alphaproteobacteria bacterium]|jgi:uncharacterized membrane protein|nr:DUF1211 domain-containing protein [Alphaproteobacteria bacterium]MBT5389229.1 DUF1211 domain-containing protein [Alphaproteobacteria bacterium]
MSSKFKTYYSPARTLCLSDGIIAIAITLAILNINLPNLPKIETVGAILDYVYAWDISVFSYLISFYIIAYCWIAHHALFQNIKQLDINTLWINFLYLLMLTFIPYSLKIVAGNLNSVVAEVLFSLNLGLVGLSLWYLWNQCIRKKFLNQATTTSDEMMSNRLMTVTLPAVSVVAVGAAFIVPGYSFYVWLAHPVANFLLNRYSTPRKIVDYITEHDGAAPTEQAKILPTNQSRPPSKATPQSIE